jgi:hypothetical protein
VLPDAWKAQLGAWAMSVGVDGLLWPAAAALAVVDLGLLAAALVRFRRARLMLD